VGEDRGELGPEHETTVRMGADEFAAFDDFAVTEQTNTDRWFGDTDRWSDKTQVDSTPAALELAPGTHVGEYEVEEKIGEGSMGTIYRCVHPTIGKRVAVKLIASHIFEDPASVKRFIAEARAVAKIGHPNIVQVFGFGRLRDGRMYLTMEWLEGASLGARIAHDDIAQNAAVDILRQITRALEAAHAEKIVHRDLKPDNVFLQRVAGDEFPVVKLLDFGLHKTVGLDDSLHHKGQIIGTPMYMSPEQCRGDVDVDASTDVYALGCLAYQLLAGRLPFAYTSGAELIAAHLSEQPPRPRELRDELVAELDSLLFGMIAKEPQQRPTLRTIRRTLAGLGRATPVAGIPIVAPEPAREKPPAPRSEPTVKVNAVVPRSRWPIAIVIVLLWAAAAIAFGVHACT
jgi:serine/threonine-protein kinase